jgi:peptidoglycan hydrolase-like protein with peptidoglycan-binding domain
MIRSGSRGGEVKSFQQYLIRRGYLVAGQDDGIAGPKTIFAIKSFQAAHKLEVDGVAGPKTLAVAKDDGWVKESGASKAQLQAAEELGMPIEILLTVEAVESGGRATAIRFEPHVFLRKRKDLKDQVPFTKGPRGYSITRSETNKAAFEHAFRLDPKAAVESTSFGLYQVLGGHLLKIYGTPGGGVDNFYADPVKVSYQLLASWFKASPKALQAALDRDWEQLARRYNGPGQVPHYSAALQREYAKVTA